MNLGDLITILAANPDVTVHFMLPDRSYVPAHFHVTEVGRVQKDFIDCGGTVRNTESCVLQVWVANDVGHRLDTIRFAKIIQKGAGLFSTTALPVEAEYDNGVISQYPVIDGEVTPSGLVLHLGTKHTACLAPDLCGVQFDLLTSCTGPACC